MQGREPRGRGSGSRGRCTARTARGDGAARPALEGRAEGLERSPGPALPGSERRAGEGGLRDPERTLAVGRGAGVPAPG